MTVPSSQRHTKKIRLPQRKKKQSERKKRPPPENSHWLGFCQRVRMSVWAKKLWKKSYRRAGFTVEKVDQTWQQVSAGMMWKLELKSEGEAGAAVVSGCMFMWSSGVYKNVLNAIMEDGEATVLGLRRSKPLFFSLGGSFSYSKQPHKRLPVSLATSPSDLGPFISLPSLSMTCPHQGSYKISPFPMKHQQTFWRVWLSPRWISGVSTPPPPTLSSLIPTSPPHPPIHPPSHPPLSLSLSSANTTPLWANLRSSTSPVTGSGHGNTERDKGRAAEEGETCTKPFSWRSQCRWWEEDALRAAGGAWYGFHRSVLLKLCSLRLVVDCVEKKKTSVCW